MFRHATRLHGLTRRASAAAGCLALSLLAACTPAGSPPAPHAPAAAAAGVDPADDEHVVVWLDTPIDPITAWAVPALADGREAFVLAGYRFALGDAEIEWASERFATPIVAATPVASGWLFVAEDGAVAHAPTFLGTPSPLASIGEAVASALSGSGRAAVIGRSGRLYTSEGGDFRPAALAPDAAVLAGAFADAQRGALVLEGGAVLVTRDGGASYERAQTGAEAGWRVDLAGHDLVVTTTGGARLVTGSGGLADLPPGMVADTGISWLPPRALHAGTPGRFFPRRREHELVASRVKRFAGSAALLPTGAVTSDGNILVSEPGELFTLDPRTGQRSALALPAGAPEDSSCDFARWGARTVMECTAAVWSSIDGATFSRVADLAPATPASFSDDGEHVAWSGRCAPTHDEDLPRTLCAFRAGADPRDIALDVAPDALIGVRGGRALVSGREKDEGRALFRVVDLDTGAIAPLAIAPSATSSHAVLESVSWVDRELVAAVVSAPGEPRALALGSPHEPLAPKPLPHGAVSVGFGDARHGVAVGRSVGEVWTTSDGGASFRPAPSAVSGNIGRLLWREEEGDDEAPVVTCDPRGCQIGNRMWVGFHAPEWASPPALAATLRNDGPAQAPSDLSVHGDFDLEGQPRVAKNAPACTLVRAPDAQPEPLPAAAEPDPPTRTVPLAWGGVQARLDVWTTPDWRAVLRYRARDGARPLATRRAVIAVSDPDADEGPAPSASYALIAADARGVLLTRCRGTTFDVPCELLHGSPDKPVRRVATFDELSAPPNAASRLAAMRAPDGGWLVLSRAEPQGIADGVVLPAIDVVLHLDANGLLVARRAFAWTSERGRRAGLGLHHGVAGYAASMRGAPQRLAFYALASDPAAAAEPFGSLGALPFPRCAAALGAGASSPATPEAFLFAASARRIGVEHELGQVDGFATVDLGAACLAAFDSAPASSVSSADDPSANVHLEAHAGAFSGSLVDAQGRHALRCTTP